jgi:hypothetical protein
MQSHPRGVTRLLPVAGNPNPLTAACPSFTFTKTVTKSFSELHDTTNAITSALGVKVGWEGKFTVRGPPAAASHAIILPAAPPGACLLHRWCTTATCLDSEAGPWAGRAAGSARDRFARTIHARRT